IPDAHDSTPAPRSQKPAIGVERYTGRPRLVAGKLADELASRRLPDPHFPPIAARRQPPAIGAERHAIGHPASLALKAAAPENFPIRHQVPDPHGLISAGRGEAVAVRGTEGHAEDVLFVTPEGDHPARLQVPNLHRPIATGSGDLGPIAAESHAVEAL